VKPGVELVEKISKKKTLERERQRLYKKEDPKKSEGGKRLPKKVGPRVSRQNHLDQIRQEKPKDRRRLVGNPTPPIPNLKRTNPVVRRSARNPKRSTGKVEGGVGDPTKGGRLNHKGLQKELMDNVLCYHGEVKYNQVNSWASKRQGRA